MATDPTTELARISEFVAACMKRDRGVSFDDFDREFRRQHGML